MDLYAEDATKRKLEKETERKDAKSRSTRPVCDMPQDVNAFYKHPLVAANQFDQGEAIALLHEYQIFSDIADKVPTYGLYGSEELRNRRDGGYTAPLQQHQSLLELEMTERNAENFSNEPNNYYDLNNIPMNEISDRHKRNYESYYGSTLQAGPEDWPISKDNSCSDINRRDLVDVGYQTPIVNQSSLKMSNVQNPKSANYTVNSDGVTKPSSLLNDFLPPVDFLSKHNKVAIEEAFDKNTNREKNALPNNTLVKLKTSKSETIIKDSSPLSELVSINRKAEKFLHKLNSLEQPIDNNVPDAPNSLPDSQINASSTLFNNSEQLLNLSSSSNPYTHSHFALNTVSLNQTNRFKTQNNYLIKDISNPNTNSLVQQASNNINFHQNQEIFTRKNIEANIAENIILNGSYTIQTIVNNNVDSRQGQNIASFQNEKIIDLTPKTLVPPNIETPLPPQSQEAFSDTNQMITGLPFSVPPVPLGYRLVITHLPINSDQQTEFKNITQLIIDNPIKPNTPLNSVAVTQVQDHSNDNLHWESSVQNLVVKQKTDFSSPTPNTYNQNLSKGSEADIQSNFQAIETPVNSRRSAQSSQNAHGPFNERTKPLNKNTLTSAFIIKRIEPDTSGFVFYLDVLTLVDTSKDQDRVTYLNKGQYYPLMMSYKELDRTTITEFKSIIMLVFRNSLSTEDSKELCQKKQIASWNCWYKKQKSYRQGAIEIVFKNDFDVSGAYCVSTEEICHNAVAVKWKPSVAPLKLNLAVNCLSTDFSHQKGVAGSPLHIQIDTYRNDDVEKRYILHRCYCQIKVFSDKGADRKSREKEKKRSKEEAQEHHWELSTFYRMQDLQTLPFLFMPSQEFSSSTVCKPTTSSTFNSSPSSFATSSPLSLLPTNCNLPNNPSLTKRANSDFTKIEYKKQRISLELEAHEEAGEECLQTQVSQEGFNHLSNSHTCETGRPPMDRPALADFSSEDPRQSFLRRF